MNPAGYVLALLSLAPPAVACGANQLPVSLALRKQLHSSAVRVLLPTRLPAMLGPLRSITVITAGRTGYYIGFSPLVECGGGLSCAFLHIAGYPRSTDREYRHNRIVRLSDGTHAYFHRSDCSGATCTEASLIFERPAGVYELDAKVAGNNLKALESLYATLHVLR